MYWPKERLLIYTLQWQDIANFCQAWCELLNGDLCQCVCGMGDKRSVNGDLCQCGCGMGDKRSVNGDLCQCGCGMGDKRSVNVSEVLAWYIEQFWGKLLIQPYACLVLRVCRTESLCWQESNALAGYTTEQTDDGPIVYSANTFYSRLQAD